MMVEANTIRRWSTGRDDCGWAAHARSRPEPAEVRTRFPAHTPIRDLKRAVRPPERGSVNQNGEGPMLETSDIMTSRLVEVASRRDRDSFATLFAHYAPRLKSYMKRMGADESTAEELAQEAMLMVWRKAERFDPAKAQASTWIFAIARNLRIDALRRERRPEPDPEDPALMVDPDPAADQQLDTARREERVRTALHELPPDQAKVVAMAFFEGKPHSTIAVELDLPLGTVKSRLRLAFGRVRKVLGDIE